MERERFRRQKQVDQPSIVSQQLEIALMKTHKRKAAGIDQLLLQETGDKKATNSV